MLVLLLAAAGAGLLSTLAVGLVFGVSPAS
jgi:hypothetical protein